MTTSVASIDAVETASTAPKEPVPNIEKTNEIEQTSSQAQTLRATGPDLSERVADKISTLNESSLLRAFASEPAINGESRQLNAEMAKGLGDTQQIGTPKTTEDQFDRAMRDLRGAFHHAIEVELVAKTGTSLNSSMNKLMSGQ